MFLLLGSALLVILGSTFIAENTPYNLQCSPLLIAF